MRNLRSLALVLLSIVLFACHEKTIEIPFVIEGITTDTYPKVDGSTSAEPLQILIACKLLKCRYIWRQKFDGTWGIQPNYEDVPDSFFMERIKLPKHITRLST